MTIPSTLIAGDSWSWFTTDLQTPDGDFASPSEYSLTIAIRGPDQLDVTGTAENGGWRLAASADDTAELTAGTYRWQAYLKKGQQRYTAGAGTVSIKPNFEAIAEPLDQRDTSEILLEKVNECIKALLENRPIQEYKILGRETKYMNLTELQELRSSLSTEVARLKRRRTGKRDRRLARFTCG